MRHLSFTVLLALAMCVPTLAQSEQEESRADRTPFENNSLSTVRERSPGSWVNQARARHGELIGVRVNAARSGEQAGSLEGVTAGGGRAGSGTSNNAGSGSLSGLLDLVNQFGGVNNIGNLTNLLGGAGTGTGSATGTTGTSGMSIEDLLRLRDQLLGEGGSGSGSGSAEEKPVNDKTLGRAQEATNQRETREGRGAIGRLPKIEPRSQSQTEDRKFLARWGESMAQTLFTALALGFQSQDFIDVLKDGLRPVFFPQTDQDAGDNASGGDGGNSDGSGSGGDGDSSSDGGGIEDLDPTDSGDDGSDSIV